MILLIIYPVLSLITHVSSEIDHSPCFPVPSNLPAEPSCEKVDTCISFPMPPPISVCSLESKAPHSDTPLTTTTVSSLKPSAHVSTATVSFSMPETPRSVSTVPRSVTTETASTTTVSPETGVSFPETTQYAPQTSLSLLNMMPTVPSPETSDYSSELPYVKLDEEVSRNRIFKRQVGRANFGGCENPLLSQVDLA